MIPLFFADTIDPIFFSHSNKNAKDIALKNCPPFELISIRAVLYFLTLAADGTSLYPAFEKETKNKIILKLPSFPCSEEIRHKYCYIVGTLGNRIAKFHRFICVAFMYSVRDAVGSKLSLTVCFLTFLLYDTLF